MRPVQTPTSPHQTHMSLGKIHALAKPFQIHTSLVHFLAWYSFVSTLNTIVADSGQSPATGENISRFPPTLPTQWWSLELYGWWWIYSRRSLYPSSNCYLLASYPHPSLLIKEDGDNMCVKKDLWLVIPNSISLFAGGYIFSMLLSRLVCPSSLLTWMGSKNTEHCSVGEIGIYQVSYLLLIAMSEDMASFLYR